MLNIVILEDNEQERKLFEKIVKNRIMINSTPDEYDAKIVLSTADPQEVINYTNANQQVLLAIIDIDLHTHLDGIDVAEHIKNTSAFSQIIFLTGNPYALQLTIQRRIAPLDYITKGNISCTTSRLQETIDIAYQRYLLNMKNSSKINYLNYSRTKGIIERIPLKDVYYISFLPQKYKKLRVICKNKIFDCIGNLKEFTEEYPQLFLADRETLINLEAITRFDYQKGIVYFSDEIYHSVSIRKKRILKKKLNS